jgi:hypothetical protein
MNKAILLAAAGLAFLGLGAAPALAHHSFAMFDRSKEIDISGTVKDFQYTNPHSWVIVMVPGADGAAVEWGFESEGPSTLLQNGIKKSSIQAGDKVTAKAYPMRDGRPAGSLISITKADGTVISFRGKGPPPAGLNLPGAN